MKCLSFLFVILLASWANAQKIELVKDISQYPNTESLPQQLTPVGNRLFFTAYVGRYGSKNPLDIDVNYGRQLYVTNTSISTTNRITKIKTDKALNSIYDDNITIIPADTFAFVIVYNKDSTSFFKTNGTDEGTHLIKTFIPNTSTIPVLPPNNYSNTNVLGVVYFQKQLFLTRNTSAGYELWKVNQTLDDALKVSDLALPNQSPSQLLYVYKNKILFVGAGGNVGLWAADENGLVVQLSSNNIANLTITDDGLYFSTSIPFTALWKSDGTPSGTVPIYKSSAAGSRISQILVKNTDVFWTERTNNNTISELRKADNSGSFTKIFEDSVLTDLTLFKNEVYFIAPNGLWKTTGTVAGTTLVFEILNFNLNDILKNTAVAGDNLYFVNSGGNIANLLKTDGSNVTIISDKRFRLNSAVDFKGTLVTLGNDAITDWELWKSDGTKQGTQLVTDINQYNNPSSPRHFYELNNKVVFIANSLINQTDGTSTGTVPVSNMTLGNVINSVKLKDKILYFSDHEIWVSDGSDSGTKKLFEIQNNYIEFIKTLAPFEFKGLGYFFIRQGYGGQIWQTDGTEIGTKKVTNFDSPTTGFSGYVKDSNNIYVFAYSEQSNDMWQFDGSANGFQKKLRIGGLDPILFKNKVMLISGKPDGRNQFIVLNLSTLSTDTLDFNAGKIILTDDYMLMSGYFYNGRSANLPVTQTLYRSDGTTQGTVEIKNITPNWDFADNKWIKFKGEIFFQVKTNNGIIELWKTRGTAQTTTLVKSTITESYNFNFWFDFNNSLYFSDYKGLWHTDGTTAGTKFIKSNFDTSYQSILFNNQMLFSGYDGNNASINLELYKLYLDNCIPICIPTVVTKTR